MSKTAEENLKELGIELPAHTTPKGNYIPFVVTGNLVYVSGQIPMKDGELAYKGKCGVDTDMETAQAAAKLCCINLIVAVKAACGGDLEKVEKVVRLGGFVSCPPDYCDQPYVVNGASDLMHAVFGEKGRHCRTAVGVASLPLGACVEVDAIFQIKN